jgi:hypothetical protein
MISSLLTFHGAKVSYAGKLVSFLIQQATKKQKLNRMRFG